jgi:hypothetical protein
MELHEYFAKDGPVARVWNSPSVGVPLWILSAGLTLYWTVCIPSPGKAIGALAVVAGIMSVRDIQVLGKIGWVALLICMVITEFRAIDKDRDENRKQQKEFFDAQSSGFATTASGLTAAINSLKIAVAGIDSTLDAANITIKQTHPHADVEFLPAKFAEAQNGKAVLPFPQPIVSYGFDTPFVNYGNDPARVVRKLTRIYVGARSLAGEQALVTKFENEWKNADRLPENAILQPNVPGPFWIEWHTFTDDERKAILNFGSSAYFLGRIEYSDSTGTWTTQRCDLFEFEIDPSHSNPDIAEPCTVFNRGRYRATRPEVNHPR